MYSATKDLEKRRDILIKYMMELDCIYNQTYLTVNNNTGILELGKKWVNKKAEEIYIRGGEYLEMINKQILVYEMENN